jgi:hypothetical protein
LKKILLVVLLLSMMLCRPQSLRKPVSVAYAGAGAYSKNHADVFSFTTNQAALSLINNSQVGIYSERKFLLPELTVYQLVLAFVTRSGNIGIKTVYSGFGPYNEIQGGAAYARTLGKKAAVGIQFNYNGISVAGYGKAFALTAELGALFHITDELHMGIHIDNPVGGRFGMRRQEKVPSVYTIGFGYEPSEDFFTSVEIIKEEKQPVNVNAGIQYRFARQLLVRAGVSSDVSLLWMGAGVLWKTFRVDLSAAFHPQLGISPGLLVLFQFKKKRESETGE